MIYKTISLLKVFRSKQPDGWLDIFSGKGKIYFISIDTWIPTSIDINLSWGKSYKFQNREGKITTFTANDISFEEE